MKFYKEFDKSLCKNERKMILSTGLFGMQGPSAAHITYGFMQVASLVYIWLSVI